MAKNKNLTNNIFEGLDRLDVSKKIDEMLNVSDNGEELGFPINPVIPGVMDVPLDVLEEYSGHPFKVLDDEGMEKLKESIELQGIINPIICRPIETGGMEILVGHRRVHACRELGLNTIPARILDNCSDEDAALMMVDSNIQRTNILPSEKAFAYKIKMEALNRKGIRSGDVIDSAAEIGKDSGESRRSVFRYIRLTFLIPGLLDLCDDGLIAPTSTAYSLSYLSEAQQQMVLDLHGETGMIPNSLQAEEIKKYAAENELTKQYIMSVIKPFDASEYSLKRTEGNTQQQEKDSPAGKVKTEKKGEAEKKNETGKKNKYTPKEDDSISGQMCINDVDCKLEDNGEEKAGEAGEKNIADEFEQINISQNRFDEILKQGRRYLIIRKQKKIYSQGERILLNIMTGGTSVGNVVAEIAFVDDSDTSSALNKEYCVIGFNLKDM